MLESCVSLLFRAPAFSDCDTRLLVHLFFKSVKVALNWEDRTNDGIGALKSRYASYSNPYLMLHEILFQVLLQQLLRSLITRYKL